MTEAIPFTTLCWPTGARTTVASGTAWLAAARAANCPIPTGCLGGSCGACEITVNGDTVRACVSVVPASEQPLTVESWDDPAW
ncbi:MAG: 2Fe-2S iron-sulfur cluster-binding protein [Cyanobacteriota bacterium]|nr:2Fe-2S iron-sulfur cluster-binding protein [Cyanobacteriota bacterium]